MRYEMIDCPECGGSGSAGNNCKVCEYGNEGKYSPDACTTCKCEYCTDGKIKSDYLIIDDPVEAVLFLGKEVLFTCNSGVIMDDILLEGIDLDRSGLKEGKFKIHKSIVKEACEPKDGDSIFIADEDFEGNNYLPNWSGLPTSYLLIKANALTIGKTVGELKALIDWYK